VGERLVRTGCGEVDSERGRLAIGGTKSAKARYGPAADTVSGTVQVPSALISGWRCWNPAESRRTTIRCICVSCSTSNAVTGAPSEPVIRKEKVSVCPGVSVRSVHVRV
jgi:hypothetical protein